MANAFGPASVSSADGQCYQHGGATITVTIKQKAASDPPLPRIAVRLTEQAAFGGITSATFTATKTTTKHGVAEFTSLRPGRYDALASHAGYAFIPDRVSSAPSTPTTSLELIAFPTTHAIWGCDTNQSNLILETAKRDARPCAWVGRYLGHDATGDPPLAKSEARRYGAAGLDLVLLWERFNTRTETAASVDDSVHHGKLDARRALDAMSNIGCGKQVVYFTADFTMTKHMRYGGPGALVKGYFQGVNHVFGGNAMVGAYGTYETLAMLFDAEPALISWGWQQTFGAKGKTLDNRVQIYQYDIMRDQVGWLPNSGNVAGGLDMDVAIAPRFGQFRF